MSKVQFLVLLRVCYFCQCFVNFEAMNSTFLVTNIFVFAFNAFIMIDVRKCIWCGKMSLSSNLSGFLWRVFVILMPRVSAVFIFVNQLWLITGAVSQQ